MGGNGNSELDNRAIVRTALEMADERKRKAFLDQTCGDDVLRRQAIDRMLASCLGSGTDDGDSASEGFAPGETLANKADESLDFDVAIHPTIDRYKLLEPIGEGGMGVVYMAQQTEPVKRRVALKLIKPGMDSREVIARFEAERQALAMMAHPHIASVLDAGTTAEGRPYFVMELVRGIPITYYCDYNRLAVEDRLRLLIDVCHAVQHAHQKGIIHRDLKPSNVLVTLHDSVPKVKVIDFGVAKALNQELTERTLFTQFTQMVGTPLYMSPEQAEMSGLDIDTRSDVYSLGVLLYELLTGTTPFDKETFSRVGLDGMRRMIRDEEPPRPSARVSMFQTVRLTTTSDNRRLNTRVFFHKLRGELDWIVMRALEKDRNRRYESASMLAADLQRYLDHEPVEACPPSTLYRVRKMIRRHQGAFFVATLTIVLMLMGIIVSSRLAIRASHAESTAKLAQQEAERTAEDMRRLLYSSDVMLASQAWRHHDIQQARERLARHIPRRGQSDLRGFEWHVLWNQQSVTGREIADLGFAVYDMALSPDGNLMAATGADAQIHMFDLQTEAPRFTIATQQSETNGIDFSPDSQWIAATGDDGTIRVWDVATGKEHWTAPAYDGIAFQVRYSPDGQVLTTCGEHHEVRQWNAATGAPLGSLNTHDDWLETIAMSPTGIVAAGDRMSRITLWDITTGALVRDLGENGPDPISSVKFSKNGYLAFGTVGGLLSIADAGTGAVTSQQSMADGIQSLDFSPSGTWLAVGDRAGNLRIIPFERGRWDLGASREWPAHGGRIYAMQVSPDGQRIFSGGSDGRVMAWKSFSGGPGQLVHFAERLTHLGAVDDTRLVVSGYDTIAVCDRMGKELRRIETQGHWQIYRTTAARRVFGSLATEVAAWDVDSGEQVFRWKLPNKASVLGFAPAPDGQAVFVAFKLASGDRYLQMVSVGTGMIIAERTVQTAQQLDVSPDGQWLAFDANNDIQLFDIQNRKLAGSLQGHQGAIRALQFSQDGRRLGSLSADRTLKLWSIPSGKLEYSVIAHRTDTDELAISPDGLRIATSGSDRMLRLWDGRGTEALWEYPIPTGQLRDLCFSADGQRLVCLGNQHDLLILDGSPSRDLDEAEQP
jgi:eukaryotic-like serine/threonine-protein kinase